MTAIVCELSQLSSEIRMKFLVESKKLLLNDGKRQQQEKDCKKWSSV
jgi:hypothetical protein